MLPKLKLGTERDVRALLNLSPHSKEWPDVWAAIQKAMLGYLSLRASLLIRPTPSRAKEVLADIGSLLGEILNADWATISLLMTEGQKSTESERFDLWERWPEKRLDRLFSDIGELEMEIEAAHSHFSQLTSPEKTGPVRYLIGQLAFILSRLWNRQPRRNELAALATTLITSLGQRAKAGSIDDLCKRLVKEIRRNPKRWGISPPK